MMEWALGPESLIAYLRSCLSPMVIWAGIGRSMEGKDLAGFGQKLLKAGSENEWKATLLLTIDLCVSQHKVIDRFLSWNLWGETLPAEWIMDIHSGIPGPVGSKHHPWKPHGTVRKFPPWASGDWNSSASSTVSRSVVWPWADPAWEKFDHICSFPWFIQPTFIAMYLWLE